MSDENNHELVGNQLNKYGLYDLQELCYQEHEIKSSYNQILKPLSQFAPYIYEDATFSNFNKKVVKDESDLFAKVEHLFNEEVLPLNDLITEEPNSINEFMGIIKRRLKVRDLDYLTKENQEDLVQVAIQEAKFKWKEMKRLIEDPSLSHSENIELRRRVFVNAISICEKIYNFYILKADMLKSRQIFNDRANFSRLKTIMASDVQKFLNIHSLKHYLIMNMKSFKRTQKTIITEPIKISHKIKSFTLKDLVDDFRLKYEIDTKRKYKNKKEHLKEIYSSMPILEIKNLEKILNTSRANRKFIAESPKAESIDRSKTVSEIPSQQQTENDLIMNLESEEVIRPRKKRSKSINVLEYPKLADELNINIGRIAQERFKTTDVIRITFIHGLHVRVENEKNKRIKITDLKDEDPKAVAIKLKKDLDTLITSGYLKGENNEDTLLMTLTSKPNHEGYMSEIKKKIKAIDDRYRNFLDEIKLPVHDEFEHPQPATFEFNFYNNFPIRLSDIRVSTRVLRYNMTLKPFPPLYNNISGEINSDMVQHLDRNLQIGGEVKEVYDELVKTISDDHLRFDIDDFVHKAPTKLRYVQSYTSATLLKYGTTKSVNQELLVKARPEPPWGNIDYRDWNKTPLLEQDEGVDASGKKVIIQTAFVVPQAIKPEKMEQFKNIDPSTLSEKEYKSWYNWWINHYSSQDYLKYLSTQNSDYLSLIFHLYGDKKNEKNFIATDQEKELIEAKIKAEKDREMMIRELEIRKKNYEPGMWNCETVALNGLGNEPRPGEDEDPVLRLKKSLEETKTEIKKILLFKTENPEEKEEEEAKIRMRKMMVQDVTFSPQQRLERIWNMLRMSETDKLDMAIKYCTNEYATNLLPAIDEWEKATDLIVAREKQLFELENFEKLGSDPNRFFMRGFRGSSAARLGEAQHRDNIYKIIDELQGKLEVLLLNIQKRYKDTISYNGRNYLEKMKWDRIEMLHWLTEERRIKYFKHEIRSKQLKVNMAEIRSSFAT